MSLSMFSWGAVQRFKSSSFKTFVRVVVSKLWDAVQRFNSSS